MTNEPLLADVAGVGPATAKTLTDSGYPDVQSVADADIAELAAVRGFGPVRAAAVSVAAHAVLGAAAASRPAREAADTPSPAVATNTKATGKSKPKGKKAKDDTTGKKKDKKTAKKKDNKKKKTKKPSGSKKKASKKTNTKTSGKKKKRTKK